MSLTTAQMRNITTTGLRSRITSFRVRRPIALLGSPSESLLAQDSAVVSFRLNEACYVSVEYGPGGAYNEQADVLDASTSFVVDLSGLSPGTEYDYRIRAVSQADGVEAVFTGYSFETVELDFSVYDSDPTPNEILTTDTAGTEVPILMAGENAAGSITWSLTDDADGLFGINASTGRVTFDHRPAPGTGTIEGFGAASTPDAPSPLGYACKQYVEGVASSVHRVYFTGWTPGDTATQNLDVEVYVGNALSRDRVNIAVFQSGAGTKSARFNTADGSLDGQDAGITGTMVDEGGGWYRFKIAWTPLSGVAVNPWINMILNEAGASTYTGDGSSGVTIGRVYGGAAASNSVPSALLGTHSITAEGDDGVTTAQATYNITASVAEGSVEQTAASSAALFTAATTAGPWDSWTSDAQKFQGGGIWSVDSLWNTNLNSSGRRVSWRFRAGTSGLLTDFIQYWEHGSGYAGGNGGNAVIELWPDNGSGLPDMSGSPLSTVAIAPQFSGGFRQASGNISRFDEIVSMAATTPVVAGNLYHLVFRNTGTSPASNFYCADGAYGISPQVFGGGVRSTDDVGVMYSNDGGSSWITRARHMPNLAVKIGTQWESVLIPMESGNIEPDRVYDSTNAAPVRERIILDSTRTLRRVWVKTATETGGYLDWALTDSSGTVLKSGVLREDSPNLVLSGDSSRPDANNYRTYLMDMGSSGAELTGGATYYLLMTPRASAAWTFAVVRDGRDKNYKQSGAKISTGSWQFTAQHFRAGEWQGAYRDSSSTSPSTNFGTWRNIYEFTS